MTWLLDFLRGAVDRMRSILSAILRRVWQYVVGELLTNVYVVGGLIYAFVRAMGVTVQSGQHAVRFTLGRAGKRLEPGFHFLVPFAQVARVVPTRSRTMELAGQRVVTCDGLVVEASASLVWRIEDVTKSLVEVDDLLAGMRRWLVVAVARVLSRASREELGLRSEDGSGAELDARLEAELGAMLSPWGVRIERAGFPSIAPSPRTAAILQTGERVRARRAAQAALGGEASALLAASGRAWSIERRAVLAARRERDARARRPVPRWAVEPEPERRLSRRERRAQRREERRHAREEARGAPPPR